MRIPLQSGSRFTGNDWFSFLMMWNTRLPVYLKRFLFPCDESECLDFSELSGAVLCMSGVKLVLCRKYLKGLLTIPTPSNRDLIINEWGIQMSTAPDLERKLMVTSVESTKASPIPVHDTGVYGRQCVCLRMLWSGLCLHVYIHFCVFCAVRTGGIMSVYNLCEYEHVCMCVCVSVCPGCILELKSSRNPICWPHRDHTDRRLCVDFHVSNFIKQPAQRSETGCIWWPAHT